MKKLTEIEMQKTSGGNHSNGGLFGFFIFCVVLFAYIVWDELRR